MIHRVVVVLLCLFISSTASAETKLVLLGTGTPNADSERSGPSVAVVVDGKSYIVDFGPGVVRRAAKAAAKHGIDALKPENLRTAFVTHLHTDHTAGYPDLIFTPWVLERDVPLNVVGPIGTARMTDHILKAYDEDIRMRIDGLEPANENGWKVDVDEVKADGVVYVDDRVEVEAFHVCHGEWKHALGYKFVTKDKTIVISGDTAMCPIVAEKAKGADILLHEVYNKRGYDRRSYEWIRYHGAFHTSTIELAEIANQARPKLVVLYHQLFMGRPDEAELISEMAAHTDVPVVSGHDLDVF